MDGERPQPIYMADIRRQRIDLPDDEELQSVCRRIAEGDIQAEHRLIESCLPLAVRFASRYRCGTMDIDDRIQAANLGLIRAAKRYDSAKGKFTTYAMHWMRQSIQREANISLTVHIPNDVIFLAIRVAKFRDAYFAEHGETPAPEAICEGLGITASNLERVEKSYIARELQSFDFKKTDADPSLHTTVGDPAPDMEAAEDVRAAVDRVRKAMRRLDGRRKKIIALRADGYALTEIGSELGISRERVRQLERSALGKIAKSLGLKGHKMSFEKAQRKSN